MHVSQACWRQMKPSHYLMADGDSVIGGNLLMLLPESLTSKLRFMQSSGESVERAAARVCPRRHSNGDRSDTSINSPSPTKFTLVFRALQ